MEEVTEVVESRQRILLEEDAQQAHYTANLMAAMGGKKVRPERIRYRKPASEVEQEERKASVTSLDSRRKRNNLRNAFAATRQGSSQKSG